VAAAFPTSPHAWSVAEVVGWVESKGFAGASFLENLVDGKLLRALDDAMLKEDLGVVSKLHRKRFLLEVEHLYAAAGPSETGR
jgi:hypothetical protein